MWRVDAEGTAWGGLKGERGGHGPEDSTAVRGAAIALPALHLEYGPKE